MNVTWLCTQVLGSSFNGVSFIQIINTARWYIGVIELFTFCRVRRNGVRYSQNGSASSISTIWAISWTFWIATCGGIVAKGSNVPRELHIAGASIGMFKAEYDVNQGKWKWQLLWEWKKVKKPAGLETRGRGHKLFPVPVSLPLSVTHTHTHTHFNRVLNKVLVICISNCEFLTETTPCLSCGACALVISSGQRTTQVQGFLPHATHT